MRSFVLCCCALVVLSAPRVAAQGGLPTPLALLDVPFISQSEALCGGASAAMVLRYWGERGVDAESFAPLVDRSAAGIRTAVLTAELQRRGWMATGIGGSETLLEAELARGRPVLALVEDRPGAFHYVVLIGWHDRGVVFHDPARGPFVVMSRETFARRWEPADRWMAVITPGASKAAAASLPIPPVASGACGEVVAEGVKLAQANDLAGAERLLASAAGCPAAARELAGIRVLQKRWAEAADLAASAIASGDEDRYAWQVLATSRFVQNDRVGALDAWNAAGEPKLDIIRIDGLNRTRHRVVEELIALPAGSLLTNEALLGGRRRLAELPAASATRLDYVPVAGGLAEIRAFVGERPVVPGALDLLAIGLVAATRREVTTGIGSPTGSGERVWASWRFWTNRRRIAGGIEAPAAWGGLWSVEGATERQGFNDVSLVSAERSSLRLGVSNWLTGRIRLSAAAGLEEWGGGPLRPALSGSLRYLSPDDRFTAALAARFWTRESGFAALSAAASARSSSDRRGTVLLATAATESVSRRTPLDLWPAGDTGHARPTLLRAHPVLDEGRLRVERLGRHLFQSTVEVQRWRTFRNVISLAGALFVDGARTGRPFAGSPRADIDGGLGVRLAIAGIPGTFRVDLARGFRDGTHAISVAYGQ